MCWRAFGKGVILLLWCMCWLIALVGKNSSLVLIFFSLFSNFVPGMISIKHSFFFLKSAHTCNNVSLVDYTGALVANEFYYFLLPFCNSGFELFRKKNCIYIHLFFDLKGKIYPFLSHLTILKNVRNSQKYQNVCI